MLDHAALRAHLDGVQEALDEARAAVDVSEEGDVSAVGELRGIADDLADRVAALKLDVASTGFSG